MSVKLTDYFSPDLALLELKATDKTDVLLELSEFAKEKGLVPDAERMFEGLMKREELISTGIGDGVAIPHARVAGVEKIFIIFARSKKGIDFDSLDGEPARLFVTIVGPEEGDKDQLKILSRTARLLKQSDFRERFLAAASEEEALRCVREGESWW